MKLSVILGDQLFPLTKVKARLHKNIFMAETKDLCTRYKYHKQKIYHSLASMRHYRAELEASAYKVHYKKIEIDFDKDFLEVLENFILKNKVGEISIYKPADRFIENPIISLANKLKIRCELLKSPMFIRDETWFEDYMKTKSKPFMKSFYEKIRTETGVLMDKNNRPEGGKYSYDAENRKKLPKTIEVPPVSEVRLSDTDKSVSKIVSKLFPDHPGDLSDLWLATSRKEAKRRWNHFKKI